MALIGIGGLLASGKDTVADYLVDEYAWHKMGMSDPLHNAMLTLNAIVAIHPHSGSIIRYGDLTDDVGYVEAKNLPEYRRLLQVFGTEVVRELFGNTVWVDNARKRIKAVLDAGGDVILTGLRYPNEVELIRELGGTTWWVDRPGFLISGSTHTSENSVSEEDFDVTIENVGTLADLYAVVDQEIMGAEPSAEDG